MEAEAGAGSLCLEPPGAGEGSAVGGPLRGMGGGKGPLGPGATLGLCGWGWDPGARQG